MTGTLVAHLLETASERAEHLAVADGSRRLTYRQFASEAGAVAAGLRSLGVGRGDRVAVVMPNRCECAVAIYAVALAGGAVVPLDPSAPAERLTQVFTQAGARAVICDSATVTKARSAAKACSTPPRMVVVGSATERGEVSYGDLIGLDPIRLEPLLDVDLATILYTSGSTGVPKGATFLHRNVDFVSRAVIDYLQLHAADRVLSVLSLAHTYGLYQLVMSVRIGAALHLRPRTTLPGDLLKALAHESITVLPGVPTLWHTLTSNLAGQEAELPALRILTNAGAALPPPLIDRLRKRFPHGRLFLMYGQTECNRISYLPPEQVDRRPDSVGIPIPGTQAFVRRKDGTEARPGEVGELWVRGDHVLQGYWGDPKRTAGKLLPGRFGGDRVLRTGDLFRRDEEGYLYFVARMDDIITTRGEKVAPLEVERVLCAVAGVCEVAVVGPPDERLGQRVVAHVSTLPGVALDAADLRRHCARHLEDFKVPHLVVLHESLPRLGSGKIDRMALLTHSPSVVEDAPV